MGRFSQDLNKFLQEELPARPSWNKLIPDELYSSIESEEDFLDFLRFIGNEENLGTPELVEYGCEETLRFVQRLPDLYENNEVRKYAESKGIKNHLSYLAYTICLAYGNE